MSSKAGREISHWWLYYLTVIFTIFVAVSAIMGLIKLSDSLFPHHASWHQVKTCSQAHQIYDDGDTYTICDQYSFSNQYS